MGACGAKGRIISARKQSLTETNGPKDELAAFYTVSKSQVAPKLRTFYDQVLAQDTEEVETLNLQFSCLGPEQIPFLTRLLPFYPKLRVLKLWKAKITAEGARLLAPSLLTLEYLEVLGLEDNKLGDDGAIAISEALSSYTRIQTVLLQVNELRDAGVAAISSSLANKPSLEVLDISENLVTPHRLEGLIRACGAHVRVLELVNCSLGKEGADVLLREWGSFRRLEKLRVSGNGFGDELERKLLEKSPQVRVLV